MVWCLFWSIILQESELERLTQAREAENKFIHDQNELEIQKTKEMAAIETHKFKDMVGAIGADTIASIATSGPEMQVRKVSWSLYIYRMYTQARYSAR